MKEMAAMEIRPNNFDKCLFLIIFTYRSIYPLPLPDKHLLYEMVDATTNETNLCRTECAQDGRRMSVAALSRKEHSTASRI